MWRFIIFYKKIGLDNFLLKSFVILPKLLNFNFRYKFFNLVGKQKLAINSYFGFIRQTGSLFQIL